MKLCMKIFAIAIIAASTYSLIGCAAPSSFTYSNVNITLSAICTDCPQGVTFDPNNPGVMTVSNQGEGGTIVYTAAVTNAPPNLTWTLYPNPNLVDPAPYATGSGLPVGEQGAGQNVGVIAVASGNTAAYQVGNIPIYTGAALLQANSMQYTITYTKQTMTQEGVPQITTVNVPMTGIPQGNVLMGVSVPSNPDNPSQVFTAYQLMTIYNGQNSAASVYLVPSTPTSPTGLTDSVVTVPHSIAAGPGVTAVTNTYQFYGGAVGAGPCLTAASCSTQPAALQAIGSMDNTVIWEVGNNATATSCPGSAVAGGSTAWGTISTTGLYTAPTAIPSGTTCVVLVSHLTTSATKTAYITIN
jgi:hypothetical protein